MYSKDASNSLTSAVKVKFKGGKLKLKGSLGEDKQFETFQFRLNNRSSLDCALNRIRGNVSLSLFDRNQKLVAKSDETDGKPESLKLRLNRGLYFLRIQRTAGEFSYSFSSTKIEIAGDRFNNALKITPRQNQGNNLRGRFKFDGTLDRQEEFAFYQFNVTRTSTISTLMSGLSANADLQIFDSRRRQIAFSSTEGRQSESIRQVLQAGTYFIKINAKSSRSVQYRLRCDFAPVPIDRTGNTTITARQITFGSETAIEFDDFVGARDTSDVFKLDLSRPSQLDLNLKGLSDDLNLSVLNASGTAVFTSNQVGTSDDKIKANLIGGTYFLVVSPSTTSSFSRYKLDVSVNNLSLFGLSSDNKLLAFDPNDLASPVPSDEDGDDDDDDLPQPTVSTLRPAELSVTGLGSGEILRDIDYRPATGKLYGFSSTNRLYTIDLASGVAALVGTAPVPPIAGSNFGIDFNPAADRLRVVSDADANLRIDPNTGAIAGTDTSLTYAAGDVNFGRNPSQISVAYTNNLAGTTSTTMYGIDSDRDVLVRQGSLNGTPISPNSGSLSTVGALGFDFGPTAGFDILTAINGEIAFASTGSTLYTINLSNGRATLVGNLPNSTQIQDLAVID